MIQIKWNAPRCSVRAFWQGRAISTSLAQLVRRVSDGMEGLPPGGRGVILQAFDGYIVDQLRLSGVFD